MLSLQCHKCRAGTYTGVGRDVQLTTHAPQIANNVFRCVRPAQPTHCANIRKELHNSDRYLSRYLDLSGRSGAQHWPLPPTVISHSLPLHFFVLVP